MNEGPDDRPMGRRHFLIAAGAAVPLAASASGTARGEQAPAPPSDSKGKRPALIVRESEPENLEMAFSDLEGFIVPNDQFYVRSHFPVPKVDVKSWTLKVEGAVDHPFEVGFDELKRIPSKTITAMLECSGNGRIFLAPKAKGLLWENGGVGNAEWTGIPLASLLERAGVQNSAVDVVLEGADRGKTEESPGEIHYARSVPIAKGKLDVLLATRMNGVDLSSSHGFPLRAIVPGWYGMASIKWLRRIIVTDRPFGGIFQTLDYSYFDRIDGVPTLRPSGENQVKSQIARPARHEVVRRSTDYRIHGASWAGESEVARVEVSFDLGKTWTEARLLGDSIRHAWRLWELTWKTPSQAGKVTLMARATDQSGRQQPMTRDPARRNGMISHVIPMEIEVE